jgi:hypothetical protein
MRQRFLINLFCEVDLIMAEENGTGSNVIWAITTIIIVAIIAGALYYSGFLGGTKKEQIDINVTAPSAPSR